MGAMIQIPRAAAPAERLLGGFTRSQLTGFIEVAIALLDAADGDPDLEDYDDDACSAGEDDLRLSAYGLGHSEFEA